MLNCRWSVNKAAPDHGRRGRRHGEDAHHATSAAIAAGADPQAYSFNYAIANPKDKKSAKKLLPKEHEPGYVVALLNREFAEATGIRHYRL